MGNSCVAPKPNSSSSSAEIIDLQRKTIRLVDLPITAAELMLENPGYVLSPVTVLRTEKRLIALKADELLAGKRVYLLIPVTRVNGKVSESELAAIESFCSVKRLKRRGSKVQHAVSVTVDCVCVVSDFATESVDDDKVGGEGMNGSSVVRARLWKPALEPIFE